MKKRTLYSLFAGIGGVVFATAAQAQVFAPQPSGVTFEMPQFWIAVIAGIVLAVGLQAVLMAASVATGLSLTPDLRKVAARRKADAMSREDRAFLYGREEDEEKEIKDNSAASVAAANSFGVWITITTSVALFLASFLAVKLGMISLDAQGVIVSLVIWAAFFIIVSYLEWKSIQSLMGGLFSLVRSGFSAGGDMLQTIFGKSPEHRAEEMGRRTVRAIYEELNDISHKDHLDKKLQKYIADLTPHPPSYDKIHDDIVELISQIQVEENIDVDEEDITRVLSLKLQKDHKYMNRDNAAKLQETVRKATRKAKAEPNRSEKVLLAAETLAPLSDKEAHSLRVKLENTLRQTGRSELDPDALHKDIEDIFNDPKSSLDIVRARLASIDKDSVKALIAQSKDIDQATANKIVDKTTDVIDKLRHKYSAMRSTEGYSETYAEGHEPPKRKLSTRAEEKLNAYFETLNRPELNYDDIRADFETMLHDPKTAPKVLKTRLSQMDQKSLEAVLSSNRYISEDQAHKIADALMGARNTVSDMVDKTQEQAVVHYERARRKTILLAEHARESAMAAAWWIVIAAVISALAASVGGWLATTTV